MNKLNEAQEKRFNEKFDPQDEEFDKVLAYSIDSNDAKQHLAQELDIQKKEIIEKLEKMIESYKGLYDEAPIINEVLNKAIETIKKR